MECFLCTYKIYAIQKVKTVSIINNILILQNATKDSAYLVYQTQNEFFLGLGSAFMTKKQKDLLAVTQSKTLVYLRAQWLFSRLKK